MATLRGCVFQDRNRLFLTELTCKGQYTDRRNRQRPPRRLWSTDDCLRSHKPFVLKLVHAGWHGPVDEPRAHCSRAVWVQGQSPDETI